MTNTMKEFAMNRSKKKKNQKREEAKIRNEKWEKLSTTDKLKQLDAIFGKNKGAKKQRAKLNKIKESDKS